MRLRCVAVVSAFTLYSALTLQLPAQLPVRVVRHAPVDTARSGDVITISFDRPVVGSLDRTPDPAQIVRVEPPLDARIQWRDPTTLRIIPREPLTPARRYRVRVSNDFTAMDGGRLEAPYEFTLLTRGPRILASKPGLQPGYPSTLVPNGELRIVYSAPIDSTLLARVARLELTGERACTGRTIRYVVGAYREIAATDDDETRNAGGWGRDTIGDRFRRVVELRATTPPPDECQGAVVLPSFDPSDRAEIRYPVATQPRFALTSFSCGESDCPADQSLQFSFSAAVIADSLKSRFRLEPAVEFTLESSGNASAHWTLRLRVQPRTTYRVRFDGSLTDVFGRRLTGRRVDSLYTGDRNPALGHQLGFFTVSRARPRLRITHVNVDSAELVIVPIPDALRATILSYRTDPDSAARMVARLRDTVFRRVALPGQFNAETMTEVPISPNVVSNVTGLVAIRARPIARRRASDSSTAGVEIIDHTGRRRGPPPPRTAIIQFTDLIAHAKVGDDGGAVLVTDANNGRPIQGAVVTTRDERDNVIARGTTDASGVADLQPIPGWQPPPARLPHDDPDWMYRQLHGHVRLVEVSHGRERTLTPITANAWAQDGLSLDQLGGWLEENRTLRAFVSPDRDIYRPGETVYVTSTLRLGYVGNLRIPNAGDSVRVRLTSTPPGERDAKTIRETILRTNAFGSVTDSFALVRTLPLGGYSIHADARVRNEWKEAGSNSFRIAEYRAPEFAVELTIDSSARRLGDTVRAVASGRYYFGAPMKGAIVRWQAQTYSASNASVPGLPDGYTIGEYGSSPNDARILVQRVDTLDATGRVSLRIPTSPGPSSLPGVVNLSLAIDDVNRQWVASNGVITLHTSNVYIAARDTSTYWYWRPNQAKRFDLLAVNPEGTHLPGVSIEATVVAHRQVIVWHTDGSAPNVRSVDDTLARDTVNSADDPVAFEFTPRDPGRYEVIFRTHDERRREVTTSLEGYVYGGRWTSWGDNPIRLPVQVDGDSIAPGDTMAIRFVSPFTRADAWITVERENVLAQRRVRVGDGESTVRIPVTERFIPGFQVSVVLVDSSAVWKVDSTHRRIRVGYANMIVSREAKRLRVTVRSAQPTFTPGDSARILVTVRDRQARPVVAQVSLWAVDQAILALTSFSPSNPLETFFDTRATTLGFATTAKSIQSLARVLHPDGWNPALYDLYEQRLALSASAVGYGSPAANGVIVVSTRGLAPRTDFRTTAFYLGSLVTGVDGDVTTTVKLPDNITRYHLYAVAMTKDDRYGIGDSSFVVTKPLFARASLPRFVRSGDEIHAGAAINNTTTDSISARVSASGRGITRIGNSTATVSLGRTSSAEWRFDWRSNGSPGDSAMFRFDVDGGSHRDAVEVSLPVRPAYAPRYHAFAGVASRDETVRMSLPSGLDPRKSRLTLRVGTSPIPMIRAAYAQLSVYPYYCSEQLSSTGQVLLTMLRLQRAGVMDSVTSPDAATLRNRIQYVADELVRRQVGSGGIAYWDNYPWTNYWLSAYAGSFLVSARNAGFAVDSQVINKITRYVAFDPDTSSWLKEDVYGTRQQRERALAWRLSEELAILHFLRQAGAADTTLENRMIDAAPHMKWEDRVWLAELFAGRPDRSTARAQLTRVWRDVEMAGARVDIPDSLLQTLGFPSHMRPSARLLRATMAIDPDHPRLAALIERVAQQGRAELDWTWNTQDYAEVSRALADLAISAGRTPRNAVVSVRSAHASANGAALLSTSGTSDSTITLDGLLERDGDRMSLPLRIESGGAPVFYVLTVDEVPIAAPTTPEAQGIIVERWFERFEDGTPTNEVTEGDLVRGRLRITVPADREFVAVEDLLPAGLEVVDVSLRPNASLGPFQSATSAEAGRAGDFANPRRGSLPWWYGSWAGGWWAPWEHKEIRDDRVVYFARVLWKGSYTATYVARATTAGTFVRPPAHAEEMYNPALGGRSEGGTFRVAVRK